MANFNRVQLIGNLGRDPELRYTQNRTAVATLSVATTHHSADKDEDGNPGKEVTEWHRVIVWSKLAEQCALHLAKGRSVFVEGRLQTRAWSDAQGQKRYSTEIIANTVQFLGTRPTVSGPVLAPGGDLEAGSPALAAAAGRAQAWSEIPF